MDIVTALEAITSRAMLGSQLLQPRKDAHGNHVFAVRLDDGRELPPGTASTPEDAAWSMLEILRHEKLLVGAIEAPHGPLDEILNWVSMSDLPRRKDAEVEHPVGALAYRLSDGRQPMAAAALWIQLRRFFLNGTGSGVPSHHELAEWRDQVAKGIH